MSVMISVVIPTLNAERQLAACLTALVPAAVEAFVREVIVVDGGSTDRTAAIVDQAGATLLTTEPGRGRQLATGARRAHQPWLMFLHADTVLGSDWDLEAAAFIGRVDNGDAPLSAATFRFALDDRGVAPACLRCWLPCVARCWPYPMATRACSFRAAFTTKSADIATWRCWRTLISSVVLGGGVWRLCERRPPPARSAIAKRVTCDASCAIRQLLRSTHAARRPRRWRASMLVRNGATSMCLPLASPEKGGGHITTL